MPEVHVQRVDDLSRCEGSLADIFLMQHVTVTVNVLEYLDIPIGGTLWGSRDLHNQEIVSERVNPGGFSDVAIQFSLGVDVKNEAAVIDQMPLHMGKQSPPVGKPQNVVDRVKHTTDHVESLFQAKSDHILPGQLGLRHFSRRNCQHSAGKVHARNIVATRQVLQNRACAATEFQDAFRPWARIADISVKALCRSRGIAHHRVIEFPENVVA